MIVEILGSGGAVTTPRPGCRCRVCAHAREVGSPYARTGPSVFVHGPDILFDTPEESKEQLNRARIRRICAGFYSHWHPDHTLGRRVWETRAWDDALGWPRTRREATPVYLPQQVAEDFETYLGHAAHFAFLEERAFVRVVTVPDGEAVDVGGVRVRPFRLSEDYVYAFALDERVLVAMDELYGWTPPPDVRGFDLAVLPMGIPTHDVFTGERVVPADHPVLAREASFAHTLEIVRGLEAKRVVLSHVEEPFGLDPDDLERLAERLRAEGLPVEFAHDGLRVQA